MGIRAPYSSPLLIVRVRIMDLYALVRADNLSTKWQFVLPSLCTLLVTYFLPTRQDLPKNMEERALRNNITMGVYGFLWEDVIRVCNKEVFTDGGELNVNEAREVLKRFGVRVSHSTKCTPHAHYPIPRINFKINVAESLKMCIS